MDDEGELCSDHNSPQLPSHVSIFPRTPLPARRLSASFGEARRAVQTRRLAWVDLKGRLVGAEEATSARAVGLGGAEGVAWEGFAPLQRVLVVAVVAAASVESRMAREVERLRRSVEIRDQVLLGMEKKLEDLCEQMFPAEDLSVHKNLNCFDVDDLFVDGEQEDFSGKLLSTCCSDAESSEGNSSSGLKDDGLKLDDDSMFKVDYLRYLEPEERRMSDISDLCSSVTSSVDIQLSVLATEQELFNYKKECQEKDSIIKQLMATAQASNIAGTKRISELEDIIKRKNLVISKLRKDATFLEQKITHLTRLRRSSFIQPNSKLEFPDLPVMSSNILYDMSSSSPSSSDSDVPSKKVDDKRHCTAAQQMDQLQESDSTNEKQKLSLSSACVQKSRDRSLKQRSLSPFKKSQKFQQAELPRSLRSKNWMSSAVPSESQRNNYQGKKSVSSQRRWM